MSRVVPPATWKRYLKLRDQGLSWAQAAKKVGISPVTAQKFEKRDPTSSGKQFFPQAEAITRPGALGGPIPLDKLCDEAKHALEDFPYFRMRYMGNLTSPWQAEAAKIMVELLDTPKREYVVFNMPPGAGKTTFVHDLGAWMTCRKRSIRGLVGHDTTNGATRMLGRLKRTFERRLPVKNDIDLVSIGQAFDAEASLWADFGRFKPEQADRWSRHEFTVEQLDDEPIDEKESTWTAYGRKSGENLGMRFSFAVWDDLVNAANMRSLEERGKLIEWFDREAESRINQGGLFVLLGQRISSTDLYRHCLDKVDFEGQRKYTHIVYKAHQDTACTDQHEMDAAPWSPEGGGCLLEPYRVPWRDLKQIKASDPGWYATGYQQEDGDPSEVLVNPLWLTGGTDPSTHEYFPGCYDKGRRLWELPKGLTSPIGIAVFDPSPSKYWAAQAWVYVPGERLEDGTMGGLRYLLDIENKTMEAPDLLDWNNLERTWYGLLEEWWHNYRDLGVPLSYVIVEVNAAQRFLLQYDHVKRWRVERKVRIIPHYTHHRNKPDPQFGPPIMKSHYREGRYRIPSLSAGQKLRPLISQLTHYSDKYAGQDDQVMANWFLEFNLPDVWRPPVDVAPQRRPGWLRARSLLASR